MQRCKKCFTKIYCTQECLKKVWSEKPSMSSSAKAGFAKSKKTLSRCWLCDKDDITWIGSKITVFQHMSDELHKEEPPHREPSSGECWKYSNGFYLNLVDGLVSESFFGGSQKLTIALNDTLNVALLISLKHKYINL